MVWIGDEIFSWLEGSAAHSNTQGKGNGLRDSLPNLQIGYGGKGGLDRTKGTKETEDVTWGSQASPQVYYKYSPSKGKSGSSVRLP